MRDGGGVDAASNSTERAVTRPPRPRTAQGTERAMVSTDIRMEAPFEASVAPAPVIIGGWGDSPTILVPAAPADLPPPAPTLAGPSGLVIAALALGAALVLALWILRKRGK